MKPCVNDDYYLISNLPSRYYRLTIFHCDVDDLFLANLFGTQLALELIVPHVNGNDAVKDLIKRETAIFVC